MTNVMNTLRYSRFLFITHLFSVRFLIFILGCFLTLMIDLAPLKEFMRDVNQPVTIYLYTLLFSSIPFLMTYVLCIVLNFSGCPFMQRHNMYSVIRIGKVKWAFAQVLSLFYSSIILTVVSFVMMVILLFPHISVGNNWGKIIHTLARTSVGYRYGINLEVSPNFIFKFKPLQSFMTQMLIVIGVTFLISLLLFFLSLFVSKNIALLAVLSLSFFNFTVLNLHVAFHEQLNHFSPISWLNTSKLGESNFGFSEFPSVSYMILFLVIVQCILIVAIVVRIKYIDFEWTGDEE